MLIRCLLLNFLSLKGKVCFGGFADVRIEQMFCCTKFLSLGGHVVFYCTVAACGFLSLLYQTLTSDRWLKKLVFSKALDLNYYRKFRKQRPLERSERTSESSNKVSQMLANPESGYPLENNDPPKVETSKLISLFTKKK